MILLYLGNVSHIASYSSCLPEQIIVILSYIERAGNDFTKEGW